MQYPPAGGAQQAPSQLPMSSRSRPEWARTLLRIYDARMARQFALHFNINDYMIDLTQLTRQKIELGRPVANPQTGAPVLEQVIEPVVYGAWDADKPRTFREYLYALLYDELGCQSIYTYTLANGLLASSRQRRGAGQPLARELGAAAMVKETLSDMGLGEKDDAGNPQAGKEVDVPDDVPTNLKILGHMLRQPHQITTREGKQAEAPIAVVLDYCEKLIPSHVGEGQGTQAQLQALETVQSWAVDPLILAQNNIIILLTANRGHLAASIFSEGSGTYEVRVALPDEKTREAYIQRKASIQDPKERLAAIDRAFAPTTSSGLTITPERGLARATQGMRLRDIDGLNRDTITRWLNDDIRKDIGAEGIAYAFRADGRGAVIAPDLVREAKAAAIERQSTQLLEIIPPERGFNEIGGMVELKKYLTVRTDMMAAGKHSPLIPSGLLLAGPPGTGKTIIAEALATEGRFNLVKMRNIQDRWVGSSERNLDMVLNLLKDLYPVVVFIDEIDQAMGQRNTGQAGDSGVSARMFARILQEMSNASNRGKILWVAATNRTDILDDALLRRFDRVVPLLAPDESESRRIFAAMPSMIGKQAGKDNAITVTYGGDLVQSNHLNAFGRPEPTDEDLDKFNNVARESARMGLTGAEIEIVVRRAAEIAAENRIRDHQPLSDRDLPPITSAELYDAMKDFKINHNPTMYDFQSLLAIRSCNFYSILPKELPKRPIFKEIVGPDKRVDPDRLDIAIRKLAEQLAPERARAREARERDDAQTAESAEAAPQRRGFFPR